MLDNAIVCDCYGVTVKDVKEYMLCEENNKKRLAEKLKDLKIAQACRFCLDENESKIDVHFSKLIPVKKVKNN